MLRKTNEMAPPWCDPTAAAWRVYADWLADQAGRKRDWLKALRYALGLTRRPKLVFVGTPRPAGYRGEAIRPFSPHWDDGSVYGFRRWWTRAYALRNADGPITPATPLDYPGMTEPSNAYGLRQCYEFVWAAANAAGTLSLRDGVVCERSPRVRAKRWNVEWRPVVWEAEVGAA